MFRLPVYAVFWVRLCCAAILAVGLVACGSNDIKDDEELEPAELISFDAEMNLDRVWKKSIGSGQGKTFNRLQPVFADEDIIVASVDGEVVSLSQSDGAKNWSVDLDKVISGGVGIDRKQIFVGTPEGEVIALDRSDGQQLWSHHLSSEVLAAPVSNDELLVAHTFDGKLYGLDAKTGEQRWVHDSTLPVLTMRGSSSAEFFEELVLVGLASGKLVALDVNTGQLRWDRRVAIAQGRSEIERIIDVDSVPLVSAGIVYAVSYQGQIAAFEAASGRLIWREDESSFNNMAEGFGNIYVSGAQSSITAYGKRDGLIRWEQSELARRQISAPAVIGSFIAVGDFDGYLHVMSQVDGHMVARDSVDSKGIAAQPLVNGDRIFVYGNSGKLSAYELAKN